MSALASNCITKYRAVHTSGTRSLKDIRWVVLHDEEGSTAEGAAVYFTSSASGGSAHLCVDDSDCYRCLGNEDIPWGAASSFGANSHGFHIEQAGFAKWSAVIWKSHLLTLKRAAYKTALHCYVFDIPVQWVDAAGLLAGTHGITTHAQVSIASRKQDPAHAADYTHSDPGPFWPRILFMYLVRRYHKQITSA